MKEKPKVPHINARAETVHKLPLFREAFAKRRCLIPATGFYEWQEREDGKQPYRFRRKDLEPFAFAGIWEFARLGGEEILSTAMIVGEANPLVRGIHEPKPSDSNSCRPARPDTTQYGERPVARNGSRSMAVLMARTQSRGSVLGALSGVRPAT